MTKNWIALEDSYSKVGSSLASTVVCNSNTPEDRNVFAIYVSYYVKVKLTFGAIGGELSVKLPFTLTHSCINEASTDSVIEEDTHKIILEGKESVDEEEDIKEDNLNGHSPNNNGDIDERQKTAFGDDDGDAKSPDHHQCVADVLVNIENNVKDRTPKKYEKTQTEVRTMAPDEELDLIVKYPGPDTWSDEEQDAEVVAKTESSDKRDSTKREVVVKCCKTETQSSKSGFAENLKRAVCCIDRRRQS